MSPRSCCWTMPGGRSARPTATSGSNHSGRNFFIDALRSMDTVFSSPRAQAADISSPTASLVVDGKLLGVIVVAVDLMKYERAWAGLQDAVLVTNSEGNVILSTEPRWRGLTLDEALAARSPLGDRPCLNRRRPTGRRTRRTPI